MWVFKNQYVIICIGYKQLPNIYKPLQNSWCQSSDVKQGLYRGPKNIRHQHTKVSHLGEMMPGICALMA
jgi:hypothetical protein